MKELRNRVAVVTGAASGIGRGLAERFGAEGMKVVLADVDAEGLAAVEDAVARRGAESLVVRTDVASGTAVEALAARACERFGAVHVVCNNAGVGTHGPIWAATEQDWAWVLSVNLWGIIHGIRAFVPRMLEQAEGHMVNTASLAGLISPALMGPYVASKHATVAISEVLARDLQAAGSQLKVSVLCPGFVRTRIAESERNRPVHLRAATPPMGNEVLVEAMRALVAGGIGTEEVADRVVAAIREERFWVFTDPDTSALVHARTEEMVDGSTPRFDPTLYAARPSRT
jgi:NAD(P)-dependent dehydrogenase (short-subunit alcohol dehydrogenase family)